MRIHEIIDEDISKYFLKENKVMTNKLSGDDLFKMCPGLEQAMNDALNTVRKTNMKNESLNMSSYKDSIRNVETSKKKNDQ